MDGEVDRLTGGRSGSEVWDIVERIDFVLVHWTPRGG